MSNAETYTRPIRWIHWLTALLVIGLIVAGLIMVRLDPTPFKFKIYGIHKSIGFIVLTLTGLRALFWVGRKRPGFLGNPKKWEAALAHAVHFFFYIALIGMPLSGWLMSSAGNHPVSFFGLFPIPALVEPNKELGHLMHEVHHWLGYGLIAVVGLHLAGVIKHSVINKDGTLTRMLKG